jgi:hypothetical protein
MYAPLAMQIPTALGRWTRTTLRVLESLASSRVLGVVLALLAFLVLPLAIWLFAPTINLPDLDSTLLSLTVAMAALSINMSIAIPKASSYKDVHGDTPLFQLLLIVILLIVATLPIIAAVLAPSHLSRVSLTALLTATFGGVVLLQVARYETNPETLVYRNASRWRILTSIEKAAAIARKRIATEDAQPLVDMGNRPMHEIGFVPGVGTIAGAVQRLEDLATIAVSCGDTHTYSRAFVALIKVADIGTQYKAPGAEHYRVKEAVESFSLSPLGRLSRHVVANDVQGRLSALSIEMVAITLEKALQRGLPLPNCAGYLLSVSWKFAERILDLQAPGALAHLVTLHRVVEFEITRVPMELGKHVQAPTAEAAKPNAPPPGKAEASAAGLVREGPTVEASIYNKRPELMSDLSLAAIIALVKEAGIKAIAVRNTDFLYRCLDVLSYTGCSAIEKNLYFLTKECARGLCYLGRVAKHSGIECYWDKCALTPYEHALEKLEPIVRCARKIPAAARTRWIEMLQEVEARLYGYDVTIEIEEDEKTRATIRIDRQSPHRAHFILEGGSRTLDFSDFSMLKDVDWL